MKFLTDEDFNGDILRGLLDAHPEFEIIRVQDIGFRTAHDTTILDEAARLKTVLITYDAKTMTHYVNERIRSGLPMPGIIVVIQNTPIGKAIEDLALLIGAGIPSDFENQIKYVPLH